MAIQSLIAALLACSTVTTAASLPPVAQSQFTVHQQATGKHKLRSGPVAVEKTYRKYGVPVPDHIKKASDEAQKGSVITKPEQLDEAYLTPVQIGSPSQTLMLDFDTGSSDLWVFSSEQTESDRAGHAFYTPGSSSTSSKYEGESWFIGYGDGSTASGDVYWDKVAVGPVTATKQAVEAATSASSSFTSDKDIDGLVGLGFSNGNTASPQKVDTFTDTVKSTLAAPVFASYLRHDAPGSYDFGFINSSKFTGSLDYKPVDSSYGYWRFTADGWAVGSDTNNTSFSAIADTGTTLVYLPTAAVQNYYGQVKGARNSIVQEGWVFPCTTTLPDLSIVLNGNRHTIPGDYLRYARIGSRGHACFGGAQSSDRIGINILGDIFLKSQYAVFDLGNTRIGFGQAV